ncbi:MAG: YihY/virulence factor BrkB family protein [Planctomycetes bacterium]|nr:YihY/virulence factor BrkB family protein [Planctomycetota bacterium]
MKWTGFLELTKETLREWYHDNTCQLGAALAYYSVFSLAPLLLIAIAIAGAVFGDEAARGHVSSEISNAVGPRVADAIQAILQQSSETGSGMVATILSVVVLLISATALFSQLQQALNFVWGVKTRSGRGWWLTIKDRFWSFAVVLGVGLLLLVSLVVSTALSALTTFLTPADLPGEIYLWKAIDWLISFGFITLLFAMVYKLLPDVEMAWRDVWVGAAATAALFSIGKFLIGLYLTHSSWISAYGAAGSLVVVLIWVYYSSQIFLLGAEFTQVYARTYGHPQLREDRAEVVTKNRTARKGIADLAVTDRRA